MKDYLIQPNNYRTGEPVGLEGLVKEAKKNAELELLNWFMKLCGSGMTTGMIRKIAHNKFVEISGEGEKA